MTNTIRSLILLASLLALPFMSGCFGSGDSNPMGVASVQQENGVVSAQMDNPAIAAAKVLSNPSNGAGKKYSYSTPPHSIKYSYKSELAKLPGSLRVRFSADPSTDHVFLTLDDMTVKGSNGKPYKVALDPQEIDLLQANSLTKLLGTLDLPSGNYNYLQFVVKSGRVVLSGKSYSLKIPSNRVRFLGQFSIKEGFSTELTIKFQCKLLKTGHDEEDSHHHKTRVQDFILNPVVKISSTMVPLAAPATVTKGEISGLVLDYVKKTPVSGVTVTLTGGANLTATTDAAGAFQFKDLLAGSYNLSLTSPDYLTKSFAAQVTAGQVAEVSAELNPAVIKSTVANTGWFSERYPLADAKGTYGEVALEAPVTIDFVSLAFTKVEVAFDSDYHSTGAGLFNAYLSSSQQVSILTNLGGWWVGNNATLGSLLGQFYATVPASHYNLDVTDYVRNNPSAAYFFAARNLSVVDIRLSNVQMTISYR